jgi:NTP pyrophosphatase (non-canonical NTP hydrolase)
MDVRDFVFLSSRTLAQLENKDLNNLHMVLGLTTEVGELADCFKKNMAYGKEMDWTNVKEEIGDLMFYIAGLCSINNFNLELILENNVNKLKVRYPDKFKPEYALNRDLETERKVLED